MKQAIGRHEEGNSQTKGMGKAKGICHRAHRGHRDVTPPYPPLKLRGGAESGGVTESSFFPLCSLCALWLKN
jgi:hypothetical protein